MLACGPERTEDHSCPGPGVQMQAVHDTLRELGQAGGGRGPVHQVHKDSFCCHRSRCFKNYTFIMTEKENKIVTFSHFIF